MKPSTRRALFAFVALAGAAALCVPAAAGEPRGAQAAPDRSAVAADTAPCTLFAVVDAQGGLRRGMHVARVTRRGLGLYEVRFRRDVRAGVFLACAGGCGQGTAPPAGYASVESCPNNPGGVLVATCNPQGESVDAGFHLLVVCPAAHESAPATKTAPPSAPKPGR
jgi:hypothetical protein